MREWRIPPELLCRQHLLGNHNELHRYRPSFVKKHSMKGRIYPVVLIEPSNMKIDHDEIAEEMLRRGYNHNSPYEMPDISYLPEDQRNAKVDVNYNLQDLINRCPECKGRIEKWMTTCKQ
jgi:hypothetical protein